MASICLSMIVKNESSIISRALNSIKNIVDCWSITDTGSIDNTQDIINYEMKDLPGKIFNENWVNFGHNRTLALKHAQKFNCDYILLMDADHEILIDNFDKQNLTHDVYYGRFVGDLDYALPILIKSSLSWEYIGSTHEYLKSTNIKTREVISSLQFKAHDDGCSRKMKFERDIELLSEELKQNPFNSRSVFYLAQSYRDIGNFNKSFDLYKQRSTMQGWDEEVWYSKYQMGFLSECLHDKWENSLTYYLDAYNFRPTRMEPLYHICKHYRQKEQYNCAKMFGSLAIKIPYPNDLLFINRKIYEELILDEMSIVYYYTQDFQLSVDLCKILIKNNKLDQERIQRNLNFSLEKL